MSYTLEEIKQYQAALIAGPAGRLTRRSLARFIGQLADAFEELNAALVEAMRKSNHDGKWN